MAGNGVTSIVCAMSTAIALLLFQVPFAVPLAIWAGFADLIPVVGLLRRRDPGDRRGVLRLTAHRAARGRVLRRLPAVRELRAGAPRHEGGGRPLARVGHRRDAHRSIPRWLRRRAARAAAGGNDQGGGRRDLAAGSRGGRRRSRAPAPPRHPAPGQGRSASRPRRAPSDAPGGSTGWCRSEPHPRGPAQIDPEPARGLARSGFVSRTCRFRRSRSLRGRPIPKRRGTMQYMMLIHQGDTPTPHRPKPGRRYRRRSSRPSTRITPRSTRRRA